jgi:hypothetical protein
LTNDSFGLIGATDYYANSTFAPFNGSGVAIAILDTGADLNHPDFGPDDVAPFGVADRIKYQADFFNADSDASDDHGWGTHTASIIAKLAPGADLIVLKVLDSDGGLPLEDEETDYRPLRDIVGPALQWVVNNHGTYNIVGVVMPFAFGNHSADPNFNYFPEQLDALQQRRIPVIAASGNGYKAAGDTPGVGYPASDNDVIAVGATWDADEDEGAPWEMIVGTSTAIDYRTAPDRITSFSQRHEDLLDIVAPGARIAAGWLAGQSMAVHGTRQAAAHVAAAVALAQDQHLDSHTQRLNQGEIVDLLQSSGVNVIDNDPGEAIQDPFDNVSNTGETFKRLNVLGMAYKLFQPAAPDLVNTSDWGFSETDNETGDTTPTITGTAPAGAYVWIYDGTTIIDAFQLGATQTTFTRTLSLAAQAQAHQITFKVADNSGVPETAKSEASGTLPILVVGARTTNPVPTTFSARINETLVVSGTSTETSSWNINWTASPIVITKSLSGTVVITAAGDAAITRENIRYNNDIGTTQFATNVGVPPVGAQQAHTNWSIYVRKVPGSSSTVQFAASQNLHRLDIAAAASAVVLTNGNRVIAVNELAIAPGGTLDMNDNDMIIRASAATKDAVHAQMEDWIVSGRNGQDANYVTNWNGTGIVSSEARTRNVGSGMDLVNLGVIRNSDMDIRTGVPGSAWTTWGGQAVGFNDVLLKFTYTGDGDLDGVVTYDDYAAMDAAFFQLIAMLGWATGDVNNDGVIDFEDYSIVDQTFFFQGNPL